jgi:hypothetical protein
MWLHYLFCFLGGVFLTNAIPHFVSGVTGRAFQTPFADPPGKGLSSSSKNVVWGSTNAAVGYALLWPLGGFNPAAPADALSLGGAALLMGLFLAHYFGKFHGGDMR